MKGPHCCYHRLLLHLEVKTVTDDYFTALVSVRHHWLGGHILEGLQVDLSIAQPLVWSWTDIVSQYDPPLETGVQLGTHYTFSKGFRVVNLDAGSA